ncbi:hypothetical protein BJ085DRAFT_36187 [Dimargaris cristalligena]|uniref:Uncharacterized protein n=1 Tax=Dimargaris cristalligena TaxID=215637 RepID=A0A4P9ZPK0_9FUNG|nr:hypothetical protein BJ085DRAFT_36187 [Dimargaris cristalligena]|eukprot:RKP35175.1 hypothetical protein BJ085DRAFT_36187 [Dimargaris cristalligena]
MARKKRATVEVLDLLPIPAGPNEAIVRVLAPMGKNLHRVQVPCSEAARLHPTAASDSAALFVETLCHLPTKFRNTVYIKRGSMLIADITGLDQGKVGGGILHVLYPKQIKNLKDLGHWPTVLDQPIGGGVTPVPGPPEAQHTPSESESGDSDSDLFQNSNHRQFSEASSSDSDTDSDN